MSLFREIGRRQMQIIGAWTGSASVFGASAFATLIYFTDWRVVSDYIPIYNTKFPDEE